MQDDGENAIPLYVRQKGQQSMRIVLIALTLILCFGSSALLAQETKPPQSSAETGAIIKPTNSIKSTSAPEKNKNMEGVEQVLVVSLVLSILFEAVLLGNS